MAIAVTTIINLLAMWKCAHIIDILPLLLLLQQFLISIYMYGNKINMKANQTGESTSYKFYLFMLEWSLSNYLSSVNLSLVNSKRSE